MDTLHNICNELGAVLKERKLLLTLAESCTGGLVSQAITDVAGSSAWFDSGFITYSNAAKQVMLGVSAQTLKNFGAVSEATASEMVMGALKHSQAHIACSITGIAGPDGGTKDKPVGTICFAWAGKNIATVSATKNLSGNRQEIRHQSAVIVLQGLLVILSST
jgi:nicotinamide-nucleotide amidase